MSSVRPVCRRLVEVPVGGIHIARPNSDGHRSGIEVSGPTTRLWATAFRLREGWTGSPEKLDPNRPHAPTAVWLYGSFARGDDNGDSDIDLLVVLDLFDPRDAIDFKVRAFKTSDSSAPFDVSVTDPDRYRARSQTPGTIERTAVSTGDASTRVIGPSDRSTATARSWLAKAGDDLAIADLVPKSEIGNDRRAGCEDRTRHLMITNQVLYQLS